jgi:two-component system KDP operon response regulator KdpE
MRAQHPRILVVDDEAVIIKFVRANLEAEGWHTLTAMDGYAALDVIERELPDLVILDIMMPNIDGLEVLRRLREWSQIPVIMLSVREEETYKVKCLNLGADDYVTKPFGAEELIARVRAVLRRNEAPNFTNRQPLFISGDLQINFGTKQVTAAGNEVSLTPTEYNLLQELALNAGKVLAHDYILRRVWGPEYGHEREYLHVFIGRLRAKIEPDPAKPTYIITVPGIGYRFKRIS